MKYAQIISRIRVGNRAAGPMSVVTYVTECESRSLTPPKLERRRVYIIFTGLFLLCSYPSFVHAEGPPDVSLRFHSQWKIGERERMDLQQKYGSSRVSFDEEGHATPNGLTPDQVKRWERLYELCMSDGCYFCDSPEGSCENHTCGPKNVNCKPYLEVGGLPKCGKECADYAFTSTLI